MSRRSKPYFLVGLSTLLGPATAALYEANKLPSLSSDLGGVWIVTSVAIAGLLVATYGVRRGAVALGIAGVIVNAAIGSLYGFLAVFFTWGGSR